MTKFKANGNHKRAIKNIINHAEWGNPNVGIDDAVAYLEALMDEDTTDQQLWDISDKIRDNVITTRIWQYHHRLCDRIWSKELV